MTERMLADAAAAYGLRSVVLRYFNVAGADPTGRAGQSTRGATHHPEGRARGGDRHSASTSPSSAPTTTRRTAPASATTSMSATSSRAHSAALDHLRAGGESLLLNCGYGHGYSVLELLDAVQRVSGRTLDIRARARRAGDVPVMIAAADRIRETLAWKPRFDDIETIVAHALAWEEQLQSRQAPRG